MSELSTVSRCVGKTKALLAAKRSPVCKGCQNRVGKGISAQAAHKTIRELKIGVAKLSLHTAFVNFKPDAVVSFCHDANKVGFDF